MWQRHWGLARDPFDGRRSDFVATPAHAEAVGRLVLAIESGHRTVRLAAASGLGKSTVLARALEVARAPDLKVARSSGPRGPGDLTVRLAAELGARVDPRGSSGPAWRALADSARLCRWQGLRVVLAVDDVGPLDRPELERLGHLGATVLEVGRPPVDPADRGRDEGEWAVVAPLRPLTRAESADYVAEKLRRAGRFESTFHPRALTRLHALVGGSPRGLERLAAMALVVSAERGLDLVPPEVVEAAAFGYFDRGPDATAA